MRITVTERRTSGQYTAEQVVEIDTSDRKLFKGIASPEAREFVRSSLQKERDDAESSD